jgi:hypothetical protein
MATRQPTKYLEEVRAGLAQSVQFFSNKKKSERERWVCRELVRNLNRRAWSRSFQSPADDPPDVVYRDFRFEVKEILDPGRRRHREYQDALAKAEAATDGAKLIHAYAPKFQTPSQVGAMVAAELHNRQHSYEPRLQHSLDLVIYVNLLETSLDSGPMPNAEAFALGGWRSVSVLIGWSTLVFSARRTAPRLLRNSVGKVSVRGNVK